MDGYCVKRKFAVLDNYIEQQHIQHMGSKQSTQANQYNNNSTTKRKRSNTHTSHVTAQQQQPQYDVHHKAQQEPLSRNNSKALPVGNHHFVQQQQQLHDPVPKFNEQQCAQLFQHYADPDSPNMISPDGSRQFFEDLGLSIEDVLIFAIAWKMQTSTMGYISREEWMQGMASLGTDSMDKLRALRPEFEQVFCDPEQFKAMYKYIFTFAKNRDQKCMEVETAAVLWTMLLGDKFPVVHEFVAFLGEMKPVKVINRDQWQSFLEFAASDISNYDESSAWPVLFDEFVDWRRNKT